MKKYWQKEWGEITLSKKGFKEVVGYFKESLNVDTNKNSNVIEVNNNIHLNTEKLTLKWLAEGYNAVDDAHEEHINSSFWIWIHNEYKWKKKEVGLINSIEENLNEKPTLNNPEQVKMSTILFSKDKCEELKFITDELHL